MYEDRIKREYFEWLVNKVTSHEVFCGRSYTRLLRYLHGREFTYSVPRDKNREADGVDLRFRYAYDTRQRENFYILNDGSLASVLEVMIAMAIICEERYMSSSNYENRTGLWFYHMLCSLGIDHLDDYAFDLSEIERAIDDFLNREYYADGNGGLFYVFHSPKNMPELELWDQMMIYINDLIDNGG